MKLYDIAEEYRSVESAIEEAGGELSPELACRLSAIDDALESKVDAIGTLIKEAETEATGLKAESDRMRDRANAAQGRASRLREYLRTQLIAMGRDKVKGRNFSARPAKASRPSISWEGPGDVPPAFRRVAVSADGDKAYEAFRAGSLPAGFTVRFTQYLDLR